MRGVVSACAQLVTAVHAPSCETPHPPFSLSSHAVSPPCPPCVLWATGAEDAVRVFILGVPSAHCIASPRTRSGSSASTARSLDMRRRIFTTAVWTRATCRRRRELPDC